MACEPGQTWTGLVERAGFGPGAVRDAGPGGGLEAAVDLVSARLLASLPVPPPPCPTPATPAADGGGGGGGEGKGRGGAWWGERRGAMAGGVLLLGDAGGGKTTALRAAAARLHARGVHVELVALAGEWAAAAAGRHSKSGKGKVGTGHLDLWGVVHGGRGQRWGAMWGEWGRRVWAGIPER